MGCDTTTRDECRRLISALQALQAQHLTARPNFDPLTFQYAQLSLLAQHNIKIPSDVPRDAQSQCEGTLELSRKAFPRTELREFTLELLNDYTRQWDPHSIAMSERALSSQTGFLNGFGFTVERNDDTARVEVVDVIAGGPAHHAGLQEGMFIWTINHKYVREISNTELVSVINDKDAPELTLGVLGGQGSPTGYHELRIRRGVFEASPIKFDSFRSHGQLGAPDRTIGYVKLRNFVGGQAFLAEALKSLRTSDALILDLRNNSGGEIEAAADVADQLIAGVDSFVGLLGRDGHVSEIVKMRDPHSSAWDGPIVVLVNSTTKSAAEILAGALQDYGALVVGTRTFGKGTRQHLEPLSPYGLNGGLYLTDAFTVRPSGKVIQGAGIQPDVVLPVHSQLKAESQYPHALAAPPRQTPLPGYDPTALLTRSASFRKSLAELQLEISAYVDQQTAASSQEDVQLEAAKRVGLFLASHTESGSSSTSPEGDATEDQRYRAEN